MVRTFIQNQINKLVSFIEINPKTQLKKGTKAKKVDMDKLMPFTRKITGYAEALFSGGSKFVNSDTLLARITPCLENGKTAYVDILKEGEIAFGSTEFIVLRAKKNITDSLFVYYLAISPSFRDKAISFMSGTSGRQRVDTQALANLEISLPPLEEQKRIAEVLGAFDDKIELLQKQNKTLEEMAKAIFKSWFVDFDIVKAKQKGEKKEGIIKNYHLTEELYNLFPSSFVDSALGPIPTGWEVKKTCEISDIIIGRTPPRKQTEWFSNDSSNIAWISIKDMGNCGVFIDKSSEYLTREAISKFRIPLIPPKTVVLSFKLTVGRVSITTKQMCSNEAIAQFKDSTIPTIYLYLALKHINFSLLGSTSSIATAINSNTIKNMHLLIPYSALLKSFDKKTMLLFDKISNNIQQIQTLTELRDTLLPRLISGKIKV